MSEDRQGLPCNHPDGGAARVFDTDGLLIDVQVSRPPHAAYSVICVLLVLPIISLMPFRSRALTVLLGLFVIALFSVVATAMPRVLWPSGVRRRRIRALLESAGERALQGAVADVARRFRRWLSLVWQADLASVLCETGRTGGVVRLYQRGPVRPAEPITIEFEPVPLDEAAYPFHEFRDVVEGRVGRAPYRGPVRSPLLRRIRRSIHAWPGRFSWLVVGLCVIETAYHITVDGLLRHAVTFSLLYWPLLLLIFLFFPGAWWSWRVQGLAVPGGLIVRRPLPLIGKCPVYLFDRRRSALCLYQKMPGTWLISVADSKRSEQFMTTVWETELALRAWLSPLRPPMADDLTDLA
jgi:hypothetical protein